MARRLLDAGYDLVLCDARAEALDPLVSRGAARAGSPADVAAQADTVLLSLPTPEVVWEVALGGRGLHEGGRLQTIVDLSTTGPRVAAEIAEGLVPRGITMLDAPVSGGVKGAIAGSLAIMVAGPPELAERHRPVLEVLGRVFHVGERPGMAQMMKLANNFLSATAMAATAEAMVLGVKAGLDPAVMLEVINSGTGRNTATEDKFPNAILPRRFDNGFATGLMYKDLRLCLAEAEARGVPMWVGGAVRQLWFQALTEQGADSDLTELVKCVEAWAGVKVERPEDRA